MNAALKENLKKNLAEVSDDLPVELLAEVIDFAEFLREKKRRQQAEVKQKKKRIAGLHQGQGWISDDFDAELGDEFWFGEDFGIIKKDDESAA